MFQKGTGERFKYKQAVKEKFPDAKCVKLTYRYRIIYYVKSSEHGVMSTEHSRAEDAWTYAWANHVKKHKP